MVQQYSDLYRARCRGAVRRARTKQIGYYSDMYKLEFALPKFAMYKRILAKNSWPSGLVRRPWLGRRGRPRRRAARCYAATSTRHSAARPETRTAVVSRFRQSFFLKLWSLGIRLLTSSSTRPREFELRHAPWKSLTNFEFRRNLSPPARSCSTPPWLSAFTTHDLTQIRQIDGLCGAGVAVLVVPSKSPAQTGTIGLNFTGVTVTQGMSLTANGGYMRRRIAMERWDRTTSCN